MLVTCYYDIYGKPEKFIEYLYLFYDMGISGIPMILFTDPSMVYKFKIFPPCVKVIGVPLTMFELYRIGMAYEGELPRQRTEAKDTKQYMSLMNTKAEFMLRASEICEDDTLVWVDFGILKASKNPSAFLDRLRQIQQTSVDRVHIPGCWPYGARFTVEVVLWRFCGNMFVCPKKHVQTFYNHCKHVLTDFCTQSPYKLTWEVNIWYVIEFSAPDNIIEWYQADHDDSVVTNFPLPPINP